MKGLLLPIFLILLAVACKTKQAETDPVQDRQATGTVEYTGTASVSEGATTLQMETVFECKGGRPTQSGLIHSTDGKEWPVPALTHFADEKFPFAPDLHNECNGNTYSNTKEAVSKLKEADIVIIDEEGELFTAYIFADNYFELYVNGVPAGKDKVPFTKFNSSLVQFKAVRPFTIAMKLVDWEEALGLGTEKNRRTEFHAGDGGMTAVITDSQEKIIAVTSEKWKAQTFYTAPLKQLSCATESGTLRTSQHCDDSDSEDGTAYYGLHWEIPLGWERADFDDSSWPNATTYTNDAIGVDNKRAYTNFTDIFDDPAHDAVFIWSTNVVLDNEVLVRYRVH